MISLCITFAYGPYIIHLRSRCEFMLSLPFFVENIKLTLFMFLGKKCMEKKFKNELNIVYEIHINNLYFWTKHYHF